MLLTKDEDKKSYKWLAYQAHDVNITKNQLLDLLQTKDGRCKLIKESFEWIVTRQMMFLYQRINCLTCYRPKMGDVNESKKFSSDLFPHERCKLVKKVIWLTCYYMNDVNKSLINSSDLFKTTDGTFKLIKKSIRVWLVTTTLIKIFFRVTSYKSRQGNVNTSSIHLRDYSLQGGRCKQIKK